MMALAPAIGRQRAHEIVYRAAMRAVESGLRLEDILQQDSEITTHLSSERLRAALNPLAYSGLSAEFVDRVLAAVGYGSDAGA